MCKICSEILKSLETLKSHKNKKAMHENEQFIYTDFGYDEVKIASIGYIFVMYFVFDICFLKADISFLCVLNS